MLAMAVGLSPHVSPPCVHLCAQRAEFQQRCSTLPFAICCGGVTGCRDLWSWNSPFSLHFLSSVMKHTHTDLFTVAHTQLCSLTHPQMYMNGVLNAGIAHVLSALAAALQGQLAADVDAVWSAIGM